MLHSNQDLPDLSGPTDGTLPTEEEDGLSVSF